MTTLRSRSNLDFSIKVNYYVEVKIKHGLQYKGQLLPLIFCAGLFKQLEDFYGFLGVVVKVLKMSYNISDQHELPGVATSCHYMFYNLIGVS